MAVSPSAIPTASPAPRDISGAEAIRILKLLTETTEKNPGCFEGEDLSVAYGVQSLLQKYGQTTLNEDGARVVSAAEKCAAAAQGTPARQQQPAATPPGTQIPIVPIVIGVGAVGLVALIVSLAQRG